MLVVPQGPDSPLPPPVVEAEAPWWQVTDEIMCRAGFPNRVAENVGSFLATRAGSSERRESLGLSGNRHSPVDSWDAECFSVLPGMPAEDVLESFVTGEVTLLAPGLVSPWAYRVHGVAVHGWTFADYRYDSCYVWDLMYVPREREAAALEYKLHVSGERGTCLWAHEQLASGDHIRSALESHWLRGPCRDRQDLSASAQFRTTD
jgi:hypothetical protein